MVFSDLFFLFCFLPAFIMTYLIATLADKRMAAGSNRIKNLVIVFFSLVFYAWGEPMYVFLMIGSVLMNYIAGLCIDRSSGVKRKVALSIGIALDIAVIGVFKYAGFIAQSLTFLGLKVPDPHLALPIGISFYIFQSISYLIDVYRKDSPVQRKFSDLLLFISMFPQLIAGPIVRYDTVAASIKERTVTSEDLSEGIYRFMIGLCKKVLIANQLSEVADQFLKGGSDAMTTTGSWVGILAFALQIYYDFSGYSDMAIGIGRCLGFRFNENFNHPYCCDCITDFWRRWHMSLGSFFRDYLYIPMGGNRRHQPLNILTVWFLTGLWHGASWNFVIWGLYFGLIVMTEKYTILKIKDYIPSPFLHIYSLAVVCIGWGIFYFDDFGAMTAFFKSFFGMTGPFHSFESIAALTDHFWLWVAAVAFCLPLRRWAGEALEKIKGGQALHWGVRIIASAAICILSIALLVGATNNAFIYTRF